MHDPISSRCSNKRVYDSVNDSNNNIETTIFFSYSGKMSDAQREDKMKILESNEAKKMRSERR